MSSCYPNVDENNTSLTEMEAKLIHGALSTAGNSALISVHTMAATLLMCGVTCLRDYRTLTFILSYLN